MVGIDPIDEDEFTELVDGHFPRVDLVGKAANGVHRFLIAKSADGAQGVVEAEVVRDLISKAESNKEPAVTAVEKADDLDAGEVFVGDPEAGTPGDAEWEQVDADTAMKWTKILTRAKAAITMLAARESEESFAGAEADGDETMNLEDAACAIDCAIDMLAPHAIGEQAEADRVADVEKTARRLLEHHNDDLSFLEVMASVEKSGRTITPETEIKIREAAKTVTQVLKSLPEPVAKDGAETHTTPYFVSGNQVTDDVSAGSLPHGDDEDNATTGEPPTDPSGTTGHVAVTAADNSVGVPSDVKTLDGLAGSQDDIKGTNPVLQDDSVRPGEDGTAGVQKAGDKNLVAVFTQSGKMIGVVDPEKIQMVQTGDEEGDAAEEAAESPEEEAAEEAAPDEDASDLAPAPSGTVGMAPSTDEVAKNQDAVIKALVDERVKDVLAEIGAVPASVAKSLQDRLDALEELAPSRVLSHGALPPTHMLRGLDKESAGNVDIAKADALRARHDVASDAVERAAIESEMNANAAAAWAAMRAR